MNRRVGRFSSRAVVFTVLILFVGDASAALLLYESFDYPTGQNLGGTDPDGAGALPGTPVGQTNLGVGGGTWYAHGTASNYQAPNDTIISSGSLTYPGLVPSTGNSVSYGSATANGSLYADSIALPASVTSGPIYASFIIRIKSDVTAVRHSPASFATDITSAGTAGADLAGQAGGTVAMPGSFWMRQDPVNAAITNFSPSKSNADGIGPGATGPSAGYQHSVTSGNIESNQFGAVNGQTEVNPSDANTYQTYFVVLKYTFDQMVPAVNSQNDTVSLWMNPGPDTLGVANGESLASAAASGGVGSYYAAVNAFGTGALDVTSINSFALIGHRQNQTNTIAVDFDELRIGTTWADVTPPVPEPATFGLALLGFLAFGFRRDARKSA